jgi:hypothetical protein
MRARPKTEQLQIRVSEQEKSELQRRAQGAGMSVSSWVLARLLPAKAAAFRELLRELSGTDRPSFVLAELSDLLAELSVAEFPSVLATAPPSKLSRWLTAYVAAMVEHAAAKKRARVPSWVLDTGPVEEPYFASSLASLRLHLLVSSPPAFKRRNLFVDATVGDRV